MATEPVCRRCFAPVTPGCRVCYIMGRTNVSPSEAEYRCATWSSVTSRTGPHGDGCNCKDNAGGA